MNETPEALAIAMVSARFSRADADRMAWLNQQIARLPEPEDSCPHGHPLDGRKVEGGRVRRYCKTCNRERMTAARAARRERG